MGGVPGRRRQLRMLAAATCLFGSMLSTATLYRRTYSPPSCVSFSLATAIRPRSNQAPSRQNVASRRHAAASRLLAAARGDRRSWPLLRRAQGFASSSEVAEPPGGWPTLSILVLSSGSKQSRPEALKQLAAQDYPVDKINEVVVSKAASQTAGSEDIQKIFRDFRCRDDNLNLGSELAGCSGQMVALWGDAQVSVPQRLRAQVAKSLTAKTATLLQPTWFFDRVSQEFQKVTGWPDEVLEDATNKILALADAQTLCADRAGLADLVADVQPNLPEDELKEVLTKLSEPSLIDDVSWAAVRSPPVMARVTSGEPDQDLAGLVKEAWPQGTQDDTATSLEPVLKKIEKFKPKPADAIEELLAHKSDQAADDVTLQRVKVLIEDSLKRNGPGSVAEAVKALNDWKGLVFGQSDVQDGKTFPVFFQAFSSIRKYCTDFVDDFEMDHIGETAERFVFLAKTMWAADPRITDLVSMVSGQELYQSGEDASSSEEELARKNPDASGVAPRVAALGLTKTLRDLAYAALDMPNSKITADAMTSLVWALGEAGVENSSLSIKAAKTLIQNVDKLTPANIGQIFVAMHERKWFRDEDAIAYLTQTLMSRIQDLKAQDPGLAKILAEKAEPPEVVNNQ